MSPSFTTGEQPFSHLAGLPPVDMLSPEACTYRKEADLRDGLAAVSWACGWDIAIEVPLSSGGRADLVLTAPDSPTVVIELKTKLSTLRQYRLGLQQADSYRRFFSGPGITGTRAFLVAAELENLHAQPQRALIDAYDDISVVSWGRMSGLITQGYPLDGSFARLLPGISARSTRAARRARDLARLSERGQRHRDTVAIGLRSHHLRDLRRNYPAMADMLREAVAA